MAVSCPECVQTVTEENPSPENNHFGPAVIHFQGAPDFSPEREAVPGPTGFPLKSFKPGAEAPPGDPYSPFIRIAGSDVIYNAPIVAVGEGPFDVINHTNTGDRVLAIHIGTEAARAVGAVRRVLGRHAVREGLRLRPADRLPEHGRGAAAHRGARALDLRPGAEQRVLQRRR